MRAKAFAYRTALLSLMLAALLLDAASALITVGTVDTPGYAQDVVVVGDLAYVAGFAGSPSYTGWLRIIDVSDPTLPVEIGALDTPYRANDVEVVGDLAYVANSGLWVIDVSDPTLPVEIGALDTPGFAEDVEVVGDLAYVADHFSGLRVVDVSDPANPVEIGTLDTPGYAYDVEVVGGLAYVADYNYGLRIIDVSSPAFPVALGRLGALGWVIDVEVVGDLAYVVDGESGLRMIDVSNPAFPVEIGATDWLGCCTYAVAVVGDLAYVAGRLCGLLVIDVSDPANPVEIGALDMPDSAYDVEVVGGLAYVAYVADGSSGLRIIDLGPEYTRPIAIDIDIEPGSAANTINLLSRGLTPVAILGSAGFDVEDVDTATLAFGPAGAIPVSSPSDQLRDTNRDGFTDLISYYQTTDAGIAFGDTEACVAGDTLDGTPFIGCDAIYVLGSGGVACGLGFELVLVLPPLLWWRRARRRQARG